MAEATRNAKIDEMMGLLRETTATQGKLLNEVMQRLTLMDSRIENLSVNSSHEKGESSTDRSSNRCRGGTNVESDRSIQTRVARLDFPRFDGSDPSGWLYRAEQFYIHQQTPMSQRLLIAFFHMEGKALWFRWMEKTEAISSWEEFSRALLVRFGPSQYDDPTALLSKLRQTSSIEHYQTQFEELANRTIGLNESFMVSCFIGGLKDDIRMSIQMLRPTTLTDAIGLARMQEEKILARRRHPEPELNTQNSQSIPIKRLTPLEAKACREKGLCYNCDEEFGPGHRCKAQTLFCIEGCGPYDEAGAVDLDTLDTDDRLLHQTYLSLHAITGLLPAPTMKIRGSIGKTNLMVLIDSGSTHNFLDPNFTTHLGLNVFQGVDNEVVVAHGEKIPCQGYCASVQLFLQEVPTKTDFYLLHLEGFDAVLGTPWLQQLGPIMWDFSHLSMEFQLNGDNCLLQGEHTGNMRIINSGTGERYEPLKCGTFLWQSFAHISGCCNHMLRFVKAKLRRQSPILNLGDKVLSKGKGMLRD